MQQEKSSLTVAEYFRTPVDLSLSLCSGPNQSGVDRQSLMGHDFYAAEAFSCRGFLSQKVLFRFISFDDIAHCLTFVASPAYAKQSIVKVTDLGGDFLKTLKKDNKYPFLSQEDQSALKHEDELYVQVIDYGHSLSTTHNEHECVGLLEKFIPQVCVCLNAFRICPEAVSLESLLLTDERNSHAIKWIPVTQLNDMYTDSDVAALLGALSCCTFLLACSKDDPSLKAFYRQQLEKASVDAGDLKEGIVLNMSDIPDWGGYGIDKTILHECLKLGVPFTEVSYFDGSRSISESLNRFLEKIKSILESAENVTSKEENIVIAEILSGLIDDEEWLSNVVIAEKKSIATTVVNSPAMANLDDSVVDDTVVLHSAESSVDMSSLEDSTLIIGVSS